MKKETKRRQTKLATRLWAFRRRREELEEILDSFEFELDHGLTLAEKHGTKEALKKLIENELIGHGGQAIEIHELSHALNRESRRRQMAEIGRKVAAVRKEGFKVMTFKGLFGTKYYVSLE